jgi:acyl carrier protein
MLKIKELIAKVLDVEKESLNDESSSENISSWDSFNGLMIVSELERNFNIRFSMEEVIEMKTINDIKNVLKKHGINDEGKEEEFL